MKSLHAVAVALGMAMFCLSPAAGAADSAAPVQDLAGADATTKQAEMIKNAGLDLSTVYVARLMVGDRRVDVTSLNASVIGRAETADGEMVSVIRFSKDRRSLELFSRDPQTGGGKYLALPLAQVPGKATFPVISDGKLVPTDVTLLLVVHK